MPKIQWTDEFSIHHREIDAQHRHWIDIFNSAHDRMMSTEEPSALLTIGRDALVEMIDYTSYHFSFEEAYMEQIGFSGLAVHKRIHQDFSARLNRMRQQMDEGFQILNSEIIKVVENWLVDHILNEDKTFMKPVP